MHRLPPRPQPCMKHTRQLYHSSPSSSPMHRHSLDCPWRCCKYMWHHPQHATPCYRHCRSGSQTNTYGSHHHTCPRHSRMTVCSCMTRSSIQMPHPTCHCTPSRRPLQTQSIQMMPSDTPSPSRGPQHSSTHCRVSHIQSDPYMPCTRPTHQIRCCQSSRSQHCMSHDCPTAQCMSPTKHRLLHCTP